MEKIENFIKKYLILIIFIICIIFSLIFGNIDESIENNYGITVTFIGLVIIGITFLILDKVKKINKNNMFYLLYGLLLFVYTGYILNTNCETRQHDTRSLIWENGGHLGYIEYILENWRVPDVNPSEYWCFSNPPLFYFISAIFVKFQNLIGRIEYKAIENLQFLSMFYILVSIIYIEKILEVLKIEKMKNYMIFFVGLSPAIVYLTGSLNNDSLALMLSIMSIFYTINWYQNTKLFSLIKLSFCISLAMMTKINSGIIAIPIAIIFLIKLIKEKENIKKYIIYYLIFGIIALPIGLWFPIRNLIKYDIPLTYVQEVSEGEKHDAYLGNYSIIQRFFGVSKSNLETINFSFEKGKADYNIFLSTLKSFIVDEQIDYSENFILKISVYSLFLISLLIFILFIISFIKIDKKDVLNIFFSLIFVIELIFYIKFCIDYPYSFSMNFRYILPMLLAMVSIIGKFVQTNKNMLKISENLIFIFGLFSLILFVNI